MSPEPDGSGVAGGARPDGRDTAALPRILERARPAPAGS
jgi:hypothetical protein